MIIEYEYTMHNCIYAVWNPDGYYEKYICDNLNEFKEMYKKSHQGEAKRFRFVKVWEEF